MITDGFTYIAVLVFIAAVLVNLPHVLKNNTAQTFFRFVPSVVLIYLTMMISCTFKVWDMEATSSAYAVLKNPLLYAMLFLMLLRCDLRRILHLGPKMLTGFLAASFSIGLGFLVSYALMHNMLGENAWGALGALCGSWMGGSGNMLAIQAALNVSETDMAYTLVLDSTCATFYIIFLLWAIGFHEKFNRWTKADTRLIDEIGIALGKEASRNNKPVTYPGIILLLGSGLLVSAASQKIGVFIQSVLPFFDKATWSVLLVTALGILLAMTPFGQIRGTEELSNVLLYTIIALIASRADLSGLGNTHLWLLTGFLILIVHAAVMLVLARLFHLDLFTCAVASLANIGGTATAPILAGAYSSALVPVGIIMALFGYVIGTGGGLLTAQLMSILQ